MAIKEYAAKLIEQDATLKEIAEQKETLWVNPKFLPFEMTDAVCQLASRRPSAPMASSSPR